MPFSYLLTNLLVEVPEAVGAILLDAEGEAVEWVTASVRDPYDLKIEGAYHAAFKVRLQAAIQAAGGGRLGSYVVAGRELVTLTHVLPDGYYVLLVMRRGGSSALARYHLRRAAAAMANELR